MEFAYVESIGEIAERGSGGCGGFELGDAVDVIEEEGHGSCGE